jgi:phenylacetate-CoA ligase
MSPGAIPFSAVPGVEWPAIANPAGASMLAMQWQLERSQWWPPEVLLEQQFRQLRALAAHAVANVPYYREALAKAGLSGVEGLDPGTFRRWPILRKVDVRPNEASLRAAHVPREHGAVFENYTTGSTGTPLRVFHTQVVQFFAHALIVRDHLLHERDFSLKFGAVRRNVAQPGEQRGWGIVNAMFGTGPSCGISAHADVNQQLDWLLRERPAYLLSYPSVLREMILRAQERRVAPSGLVELIAFAEAMPEDLRELAGAHWGVRVVDGYSCAEMGPIASQCPLHEHYLVHAENVYVEVLREDGSLCGPGETGRVVLTALHNFAMPLIRYDIGDYAEVGGPCPSGRSLPVLGRIAGRVRNMVRDPGGGVRWPSFSGIWRTIAPFEQARLVQHSLSEIEAQFVMDRDLTDDESRRLIAGLRERLGYPFEIRLSRVQQIERAAGGKFEEFLSLLPEQ